MTGKDTGQDNAVRGAALVTGSAHRIGAAIARALHADGWNVIVHANRSIDRAEALAAELAQQRADSAVAMQADLADAEAIDALADAAQARWGRLDVLVNNASSYFPTPLGAISASQFDELVASNLRAPLLLTQACARLMEAGGGVINIVDTQVDRPPPGYAAYFAAKGGLATLTRALAVELAPRIRVNGIAPGHMIWASNSALSGEAQQAELARIPLARLGGAEEIARAVRFLVGPDAAYVTGSILRVDGGLALG